MTLSASKPLRALCGEKLVSGPTVVAGGTRVVLRVCVFVKDQLGHDVTHSARTSDALFGLSRFQFLWVAIQDV